MAESSSVSSRVANTNFNFQPVLGDMSLNNNIASLQAVAFLRQPEVKFSGTESVTGFLREYEDYFRLYNVGQEERIILVVKALRGKALRHFYCMVEGKVDAAENKWEIFKQCFMKAYGEDRDRARMMGLFYSKRQEQGQNLVDFFYDKVELAKQLSLSDMEVITVVKMLVRSEVADVLEWYQFENLEELYAKLAALDKKGSRNFCYSYDRKCVSCGTEIEWFNESSRYGYGNRRYNVENGRRRSSQFKVRYGDSKPQRDYDSRNGYRYDKYDNKYKNFDTSQRMSDPAQLQSQSRNKWVDNKFERGNTSQKKSYKVNTIYVKPGKKAEMKFESKFQGPFKIKDIKGKVVRLQGQNGVLKANIHQSYVYVKDNDMVHKVLQEKISPAACKRLQNGKSRCKENGSQRQRQRHNQRRLQVMYRRNPPPSTFQQPTPDDDGLKTNRPQHWEEALSTPHRTRWKFRLSPFTPGKEDSKVSIPE